MRMAFGCFLSLLLAIITSHILPLLDAFWGGLLSLPHFSPKVNNSCSTYIVVSLSTLWLYVKRLECGGRATTRER